MILLVLVLLLIVVPVAEIYVIIRVGEAIGALPTVVLLVADAVLGSWLMRAQGRAAWRRFQDALAAGRVPAAEVLDGALVIFGGALLIAPGFLTDLVGIVFLAPPTRALLRRRLGRRLTGGLTGQMTRRWARRRRPPARPPADVEGSATEVDPRELGR